MPEEKQIATNIIDTLNIGKEWDRVSSKVKAIQKEEAIQVRSKKLKLAKTTVADSTALIPLDMWEEHIQSIEIGKVYFMEPLQVRIWFKKKRNWQPKRRPTQLNDVETQETITVKPFREFKCSTSCANASTVVEAFLGSAQNHSKWRMFNGVIALYMHQLGTFEIEYLM